MKSKPNKKRSKIMAEKVKRQRKTPRPIVDFSHVEFQVANRPLARGYAPMLDIHDAVLATQSNPGTSVQVRTPADVPAFLAQMRSTLRKNGHKVRVAKNITNGTMSLWAEEPRVRRRK